MVFFGGHRPVLCRTRPTALASEYLSPLSRTDHNVTRGRSPMRLLFPHGSQRPTSRRGSKRSPQRHTPAVWHLSRSCYESSKLLFNVLETLIWTCKVTYHVIDADADAGLWDFGVIRSLRRACATHRIYEYSSKSHSTIPHHPQTTRQVSKDAVGRRPAREGSHTAWGTAVSRRQPIWQHATFAVEMTCSAPPLPKRAIRGPKEGMEVQVHAEATA